MISKEFITCANEEKLGANFKLQEKGLSLISEGKVAIVLVLNDIEKGKGDNPGVVDSESSENSVLFFLQKSLSDDQTFVKVILISEILYIKLFLIFFYKYDGKKILFVVLFTNVLRFWLLFPPPVVICMLDEFFISMLIKIDFFFSLF